MKPLHLSLDAGGLRQDGALIWALWSTCAALPWLLPTRTPPWSTFFAEAGAAALWLPIALWALWTRWTGASVPAFPVAGARRGARTMPLDALAGATALLAVVPMLQAAGGMLALPGEGMFIALYLAGLALALVIARAAQEQSPWRLIEALWASLVIASLVSVGIALCQWLQVDAWGWLAPPSTLARRAMANVGQPNNLATLLAWGLVGLWWAHTRRRIGGRVALLAAAYLLAGMALTQSRTAWLALAVLGVAALLGRRHLGGRRTMLVFFGLASWFAVVWIGLGQLGEMLATTGARGLADQASTGLRPVIWRVALEAIAERPWMGWGWNQFLVAWVELAPGRLPRPLLASYTHNVVLDLLVWNGAVLGTLLVLGVAYWLWRAVRAAGTAEQWLLLAGLGVFAVHALLELPHAYVFFLLPLATMVGTLAALQPAPARLKVPASLVLLLTITLAALLAAVITDYVAIEEDHRAQSLAEAGVIGFSARPPMRPPKVLTWLVDADAHLRDAPRPGMSADALAHRRRVLQRYPAAGSLLRYAQAAALSGAPEEGRWALGTLCALHAQRICQAVLGEWSDFVARHPAAALVATPKMPG